MSDFPEGTIYIELRDVYDGWSIAHLPDGTLVNRWEPGDRRHAATRVAIEQMGDAA